MLSIAMPNMPSACWAAQIAAICEQLGMLTYSLHEGLSGSTSAAFAAGSHGRTVGHLGVPLAPACACDWSEELCCMSGLRVDAGRALVWHSHLYFMQAGCKTSFYQEVSQPCFAASALATEQSTHGQR